MNKEGKKNAKQHNAGSMKETTKDLEKGVSTSYAKEIKYPKIMNKRISIFIPTYVL